jgi:hypothetical protein
VGKNSYGKRQSTGISNVSNAAVDDRFFEKHEYNAITPNQKNTLRIKRLKRGHVGKSHTGIGNNNGKGNGKGARQQNKGAQIFCTDLRFVRSFPMKLESEAHEALSLLFHRYGFPNVMVMDGAKAKTEGRFRRKLCDAGCHINQTEPQTQSYNMVEGELRELKRGVGRKMMRSGCPKRLWDDFIIRESYVISHAYLDIFGLEGQVPERKVKGETFGISTIAEYA